MIIHRTDHNLQMAQLLRSETSCFEPTHSCFIWVQFPVKDNYECPFLLTLGKYGTLVII